jgi:hypothetical protein
LGHCWGIGSPVLRGWAATFLLRPYQESISGGKIGVRLIIKGETTLLLQTATTITGNEVLDTVTASAMSVAIVQWLKNTKLIPFMNQHSSGINRAVAWFMAFLSGTGIHYNFDHATGTLTLTGLTAMAIFHTAGDTIKSYALQWLVYRGVKPGLVPSASTPVSDTPTAPPAVH